ncbi:hypothetical protein Pmani_028454 [Petrolisthes manimaculis]|uniref:Sulfatase N-terminal domain-containing protein n=1 Tax=Petrolisthes manimaculis TaxID=1843537 RepID=A0AAE1TVN8_9EUCA|nr:hypothetical protein Pmani_028454 [Petrolisthes manimaculis]
MASGVRQWLLGLISLLAGYIAVAAAAANRQPHIIIIVADDLGFNDVGFHGSTQIPTPNIDALAYSGLILNNYYVQPICTPSRSALMTGKHPIHTGLNHDVIYGPQPYGLPLAEQLLPQYLLRHGYTTRHVGKWHLGMAIQELTPTYRGFISHLGYWGGHQDYYDHTGFLAHSTIGGSHPYGVSLSETLLPRHLGSLEYINHHVGKWHLGFFREAYTPTKRGFDSHFGYWSGRTDYFDHTALEQPGYWGYDLRRNMSVARDGYGQYSTDLFTNEAVTIISQHNTSQPLFLYLAHLAVHSGNPYAPLQAPADVVEKFSYIEDENRRKFAGMLWKLDESVGHVVTALDQRGMLQDSIILFTTDNGGPAAGFNQNAASNWPLRGVKASMWEGGVRGAGVLWSPAVARPGRVAPQMVHITDWLPTLLSAAGGDLSVLGSIDGIDMWETLTQGLTSPRKEFLINIDPVFNGAAVRIGDWKLMHKPQAYGHHWDGWFGPSGRNQTAPQAQLEVILQQVLHSPAAVAIKKILPHVFDNVKSLRLKAEVHCSPVPVNATQACNSVSSPCLFHIPSDPCEYRDLSHDRPEVVSYLKSRLQYYNKSAVPPRNKPWDPAANPKYWGYAWTNWKDYPVPPMSQGETIQYEENLFDDIYGDKRQ